MKELFSGISELVKDLYQIGLEISSMRNQPNFNVNKKYDGSPVSNADLECDARIKECLFRHYGQKTPIISEESVDTIGTASLDNIIKNSDYFLIDPIDGTENFIKYGRDYTVNVAYLVKSVPIWGITVSPIEKKCFYNIDNEVWIMEDGMPSQLFLSLPKSISNVSDMLRISTGESSFNEKNKDKTNQMLARLRERYQITTVTGNSCMKYCQLLSGKCDVAVSPNTLHNWDIASMYPLLKNIGYLISDCYGKKILFSNSDMKQRGMVVSSSQQIIDIIASIYE